MQQLVVDWWFWLVVWIMGSHYERDGYFGIPLESQTTGPQTTNLPSVEYSPQSLTIRIESSKEKDKTRTLKPTSFGGRTAKLQGVYPTKLNAATPKIAKI